MAGRSKGASLPLAWTTLFYLLVVFVAPLALLQPAHAQDEQAPLKDPDLGTGTLPPDEPGRFCGGMYSNEQSEPVIGIDLGTTYSYVSINAAHSALLTLVVASV